MSFANRERLSRRPSLWLTNPQGAVATIPNDGDANGDDQRLAQGSMASVCQRTVGSHSLPGYGPVISVNRPVRTRMPGGVGAGGEKPPATRLGSFIYLNAVFNSRARAPNVAFTNPLGKGI